MKNNKHSNVRKTTEQFIEEARQVHGDKYDYSKVNYINNSTKVCIICPEHGEFWQRPNDHLSGQGCPACGKEKCADDSRLTSEQFIEKARKVHGDKYDYSKVEYINARTKVCIICPEHGEFWQKPNDHLSGQGCPFCAGNVKLTSEQFIEKAMQVHGDKYDYSKVEYVNSATNVCIICPEHGEFWQKPSNHLIGKGCCACAVANAKLTNEEAKTRILERLEGTDFELVDFDYKGSHDWGIVIKCKKCGMTKKYKNYYDIKTTCPTCKFKTNILERLDGTNLELIDFEFRSSNDCLITAKCKECGRIKRFNSLFHIDKRTCPTCEYNKRKQCAIENVSKCKTLKEYQEKYRNEYHWLHRNGLLEEMTSHLKRGHGNNERLIYVYEIYIEGMKPHAYIGLTYNLEARDKQHLYQGRRDSLWKFCKEHNVAMPKPKMLMDYVPEDEASRMEGVFEQQYRERGFETINVAKCGGLGGGSNHAFEEIEAIGKKYSSRNEWAKNDAASYAYAINHYKNVNGKKVKWIDLIIPNIINRRKPIIGYNPKTKETRIYESAYATRKDFQYYQTVNAVCRGKVKSYKGWIFHYLKDGEIENVA